MLEAVSTSGRFCRWLALSLLPDVFDGLCDENVDWPEAPTASNAWMGVEDWIVRMWMECIIENEFPHMSLHFDGLRMHATRIARCTGSDCARIAASDPQVDTFSHHSQEHLLNRTGFAVVINHTSHPYLDTVLREHCRNVLDECPEP